MLSPASFFDAINLHQIECILKYLVQVSGSRKNFKGKGKGSV